MTVLLTGGQAGIVQAPPIALPPRRQTMALEPLRGDRGQMVERMAEGFPHTLQAVDGADMRQYMRRVGTLTPPSCEPRVLTTLGKDGIEQTLFRRPHDQTSAELT